MRLTLLVLVLLIGQFSFQSHAQKLGTWKDHFSYSQGIDVTKLGQKIYVATPNALFIYDETDNSLSRLNIVNGLSDVNITAIESSEENNLVIIGFESGVINVIRDNTVTNFTDIKNSTAVGDKAIRHITISGEQAYLSTGLGIIAYDFNRNEVSDTYEIDSSTALAINQTAIFNDSLFAATNAGLFAGSLTDDLTIFTNWDQDISIPDPFGEVQAVTASPVDLFINLPDTDLPGVFRRSGGWSLVAEGNDFIFLEYTPGGLIVSATYFIMLLDETGSNFLEIISDYNLSSEDPRPRRGFADNEGVIWIADNFYGLVKREETGVFQSIKPDGPAHNDCFDLNFQDNTLWVSSGSPIHPGTWNNNFILNGYYRLREGSWLNVIKESFSFLTENEFYDAAMAYQDRFDPSKTYFASFFSGMAVFENGEFTAHYDETNSSLQNRNAFPDFCGVAGFAQDDDGNLWITNSHADEPLSVLTPDGDWISFDFDGQLSNNQLLTDILISRDGYKWMVRNRGGVVVFDEGGNLLDPESHKSHVFEAGVGNGGLPVDEVYCLTEDLDGEIWVGTNAGVAVFYSPFDALSSNPSDARQILVEQDGIFQFLLESQPISTITVDGANRKWIGTFGSGVFLLSPDGTEEILRFTTANSPLPSDDVNDIVINNETGEVFIGTTEGIVSYIGDATQGELSNECNKVYPNPVRENYTGPISISGLMRNSEVKITDTRGNFVSSTESNGGTAIWDGRNLNGERVATGVYFALVSDESGESTCVSKILVIK